MENGIFVRPRNCKHSPAVGPGFSPEDKQTHEHQRSIMLEQTQTSVRDDGAVAGTGGEGPLQLTSQSSTKSSFGQGGREAEGEKQVPRW